MGRPKIAEQAQREQLVSVRFSATERTTIHQAAQRADRKVADYVRWAALAYSRMLNDAAPSDRALLSSQDTP